MSEEKEKRTVPPSNYVSYTLTMMEVAILSGVVWGFSFMQYIWEQEYLFYSEICAEDCEYRCETQLPEHLSKLYDKLISNQTSLLQLYPAMEKCKINCQENPKENAFPICEEVAGIYSLAFATFRNDL